jgi:hypothetical protein
MDPYLERDWESVHALLAPLIAFDLNPQLRPLGLIAKAERRVAVSVPEDEGEHRSVRPDVVVADAGTATIAATVPASTAAAGLHFELSGSDPLAHYAVHVSTGDGSRLLTTIVLISPANKRGVGREEYLAKRGDFLAAGVSVTEVDLCRRGNLRSLILERIDLPVSAATPYRYLTRRPAIDGRRAVLDLLPVTLGEPLPELWVPLRPGDPAARVAMQAVLNEAWERGGIGAGIDYRQPCEPALDGDDATWADDLLRAAGRH